MNSPWGVEYSIIKETGYTRQYLLWGIRWINVVMMLADAPQVKKVKPKAKELDSEEDFKDFLKL